jgi:hypothetical protein
MYERFTDRARKVMQLANQQAQRFNHEYIGTEHILLGLVEEGAGVGVKVLKNLHIDLRKLRREVEQIVVSGPFEDYRGRRPQTPRAKKVIEYAIEEARNFGHNYVGTEHLLLGLFREQDGVASYVLMNLGLRLEDLREEMLAVGTGPGCPPRGAISEAVASEPREAGPEKALTEADQQALSRKVGDLELREQLLQGRIVALDRQLASVRFLLGAFAGAFAGWLLGDQTGAVVGLLAGGCVAALGRLLPAALAGGAVGSLIGSIHLTQQGGGLAGALLGLLVASSIAEVGRLPGRSRSCCGFRVREGKRRGEDSSGIA